MLIFFRKKLKIVTINSRELIIKNNQKIYFKKCIYYFVNLLFYKQCEFYSTNRKSSKSKYDFIYSREPKIRKVPVVRNVCKRYDFKGTGYRSTAKEHDKFGFFSEDYVVSEPKPRIIGSEMFSDEPETNRKNPWEVDVKELEMRDRLIDEYIKSGKGPEVKVSSELIGPSTDFVNSEEYKKIVHWFFIRGEEKKKEQINNKNTPPCVSFKERPGFLLTRAQLRKRERKRPAASDVLAALGLLDRTITRERQWFEFMINYRDARYIGFKYVYSKRYSWWKRLWIKFCYFIEVYIGRPYVYFRMWLFPKFLPIFSVIGFICYYIYVYPILYIWYNYLYNLYDLFLLYNDFFFKGVLQMYEKYCMFYCNIGPMNVTRVHYMRKFYIYKKKILNIPRGDLLIEDWLFNDETTYSGDIFVIECYLFQIFYFIMMTIAYFWRYFHCGYLFFLNHAELEHPERILFLFTCFLGMCLIFVAFKVLGFLIFSVFTKICRFFVKNKYWREFEIQWGRRSWPVYPTGLPGLFEVCSLMDFHIRGGLNMSSMIRRALKDWSSRVWLEDEKIIIDRLNFIQNIMRTHMASQNESFFLRYKNQSLFKDDILRNITDEEWNKFCEFVLIKGTYPNPPYYTRLALFKNPRMLLLHELLEDVYNTPLYHGLIKRGRASRYVNGDERVGNFFLDERILRDFGSRVAHIVYCLHHIREICWFMDIFRYKRWYYWFTYTSYEPRIDDLITYHEMLLNDLEIISNILCICNQVGLGPHYISEYNRMYFAARVLSQFWSIFIYEEYSSKKSVKYKQPLSGLAFRYQFLDDQIKRQELFYDAMWFYDTFKRIFRVLKYFLYFCYKHTLMKWSDTLLKLWIVKKFFLLIYKIYIFFYKIYRLYHRILKFFVEDLTFCLSTFIVFFLKCISYCWFFFSVIFNIRRYKNIYWISFLKSYFNIFVEFLFFLLKKKK